MSSWCVAYSFDGRDGCSLMTSTGSCPYGNFYSGYAAKTSSELSASGTTGYNCIAKVYSKGPCVVSNIWTHKNEYTYKLKCLGFIISR